MSLDQPVLILIGGINGAGKTTLYYEQIKPFLDKSGRDYPFVNADEMERARFPDAVGQHSLEMGKLAAKIRGQYLESDQSFVTETVFSHESKNQLIEDAQKAGFKVMLNHVHVDSPDVAYKRVQTRVQKGGHDVPKEKVFSRYDRTVANIQKASMTADQTYVWDNSRSQGHTGVTHRFVMTMAKGEITKVSPMILAWAHRLYRGQIEKFNQAKPRKSDKTDKSAGDKDRSR